MDEYNSWDMIKTAVATEPLNEAYAISIQELRRGVVNALGALEAMSRTQRHVDQVELREGATVNLKMTIRVINELLVDTLGQRIRQE